MVEATNNAAVEKTTKLKSVYGSFHSITGELDSKTVSPEFWIKERENIRKANEETRKWKESMKMSFEKYHQEFTI